MVSHAGNKGSIPLRGANKINALGDFVHEYSNNHSNIGRSILQPSRMVQERRFLSGYQAAALTIWVSSSHETQSVRNAR
jgi:hypothetical protein